MRADNAKKLNNIRVYRSYTPWFADSTDHCCTVKDYIKLICHQLSRSVKHVVIDGLLKIIQPFASSQPMKCQHSNNKRAFMYYSMWHMESLSMPLESECFWEWESFFPPWSLWSSPAISLIDAYEDLFPERCHGNSVKSCGTWDIPHSSLQFHGSLLSPNSSLCDAWSPTLSKSCD